MKSEDIELIKNPAFVLYAIVFIALVILIRIYLINKSKNDKNKIIGFGFGVIPFRESMYDFLNKRHIVQIFILGIICFAPILVVLRGILTKDPEILSHPKEMIGVIVFFCLIFFGALYEGWVYKKAKERGVDATGAGASIWQFIRFAKGKATGRKTWIKWEIAVAVGAIFYVLYSFFKLR